MQYRAEFWKPQLYRDKINAMSGKPRFALREAEALADHSDPLLVFLIERSLARAYIPYGNRKKAHRLNELPRTATSHQRSLLRV